MTIAATAASSGGAAGRGGRVGVPAGTPVSKNHWSSEPPIPNPNQRLVAAGKPKKVALCAAARKLLRIAWSEAR